MSVRQDLQLMAIGALLHDIGKFRERAGLPAPTFVEGAKYTHEPHSYDFVQQYPHLFSDIGGVEGAGRKLVSDLALKHHAPVLPDEKLLAIGDRLAANERAQWEMSEANSEPTGRSKRRLLSPFSRLLGMNLPDQAYPLVPLSAERTSLFPGNHSNDQSLYHNLWVQFSQECSRLKRPDDVETWLALLQKYLWCIPASAQPSEVPDVSLYDHCRAVAAVTLCAYVQYRDDEQKIDALLSAIGNLEGRSSLLQEPLCLLTRVDISGIQSFLYTLTASGAARSLRGRSFYISMLAETITRWLLEQLGLPVTQLLYTGGGHAYLLIPARCEEQLCSLRTLAERKLLALHGGDVNAVIAWSHLTPGDFTSERFTSRWAESVQRGDQRKRCLFAGQDRNTLFEMLSPHGQGGAIERCDVCQAEIMTGAEPDDHGAVKCPLCRSFEELGRELRQPEYFIFRKVPESNVKRATSWRDGLRAFGQDLLITSRTEAAAIGDTLYRINHTDFIPQEPDPNASYGFRWLTRVFPYDAEGELLQFEELAERAKGIKRLAALRMDVDNLGLLFRDGFGKEATLSRVASVSTMLRLFFEGYLNVLCESEPEWEGKLYGLYAGGDDLFFVGAWDIMPDLAAKIRDEFGEYVCRNPGISVSAGISLFPQKYPLYQAAKDGADALDGGAKHFIRSDGRRKDAVHLLGRTVGWEEWKTVKRFQTELDAMLEEKMPAAILQRIRGLDAMWQQAQEQARRTGGVPARRWVWMSAYMFARLAQQYDRFRSRINSLQAGLSSDRALELAALSARWVQLKRRERSKERGGDQ